MKNFYKLILSTKQEIEIDEADFEKIQKESGSGNFIKVKKGVFNPAYLVAIVPVLKDSKEKIDGYIDEKRGVFIETARTKVDTELKDSFPRNPATNQLPRGDK